jgi:hypothetical protein
MTSTRENTLATAALLLATTAASAQIAANGITILVADPVLEPGASTTVRMEAYFDPRDYCMAGLETSLLSSAGAQGWSDLSLVRPMAGPSTTAGMIDDTGVSGIIAGQVHFLAGIEGDTSNPIAFWEATYTAPADVAAAFEVGLTTDTIRFDVYIEMGSARAASRLGDLAEGEATIRVVPSPAGMVVLGGLLLTVGRRR